MPCWQFPWARPSGASCGCGYASATPSSSASSAVPGASSRSSGSSIRRPIGGPCSTRTAGARLAPRVEATIAGDVATTELVTILPSETLETAARLMNERGTAHLVVVSPQSGLPVGIVSRQASAG